VLLIESDIELIRINPALERVLEFIHSRLASLDGKPRTFQVSAIGAWTEDVKKAYAPMAFRFERRVGTLFQENLYYSEAPLQTEEHLELLGQVEKMLR
jgi:hypothetical protein